MTFGYFAGVRNFGCSLVGDVGYSPLRYFGYHSAVKDCFYSLQGGISDIRCSKDFFFGYFRVWNFDSYSVVRMDDYKKNEPK